MQAFDVLVLTAANEAQADGYRAQIAWRQGNGLLPAKTRVMVMSDPGGRRVGSLGATLNVLATLAQEVGSVCQAFEGRRILICHSGGDSRRTPAYAAQGKVFTPVPTVGPQGQPLALFDLILQTVSALPAPEAGHVLITSGDVLLTFDHASVDFSKPGVTGVGYFGPVERGSHHGVYVPSGFGSNAARTECVPVRDFLQKPSEAQARASGAVDPFGHVAVDTGLISMDPPTCAALLKTVGVDAAGRIGKGGILRSIIDGVCPALDVYEEMTMAVTPKFDEARFLSRFVTERGRDVAHKARMRRFYRALHGIPFQVNIVPYCEFFHIGSSRELLNGFSGLSRTAQMYHFTNGSGAAVTPAGAQEGGAFIFNSRIAVPFKAGQSLIEAVHANACKRITLSGRNILTGLPPEATVPVTLGTGLGLVCLPIGENGWAAVVYGLDDDFKAPYPSAAKPCLFLNAPIEKFMESQNIPASRLWRGDEKDGLWRARLWRVGAIDDVLSEAMAVNGAGDSLGRLGRRYSIAELIPLVSHKRLLTVRQEILRQVGLMCVAERILADNALPAAAICAEVRTDEEARGVLRQLDALLCGDASGKPLLRARVLRLMALLERSKVKAADYQTQAFAEIASAVAVKFEPVREPHPAAILQDQVVWVTTPVRIDFAGGWSDTPPICTECGGTVLNAAVTLNGLYPVQVMAKLNTCGSIRLSSIDLGERQEIRTAAELLNHHDPHDWAALAKAALVLCGIGPCEVSDTKGSADPLARWLKVLGGGLDLTIFSSLPKGSGMGTSSVLGAAVIACLDRVLGVPYSVDRLIHMVSILEQRLCTGGGWQDQVGGILPGVKLIRTEPGSDQTVSLRWTVFDMTEGSELQKRCLLYFTGQKRMARNILQNVVNGYLGRNPVVLQTIADLKRFAVETKEALDAQDVDGFAAGLSRYWELKKRIDPGSTNEPIERLLARVKSDTQVALLPGAGGGGFIFMVARDAVAAGRIRRIFLANPPNAHARFFDFAIDHQGLKVTVL